MTYIILLKARQKYSDKQIKQYQRFHETVI